MAARDRRLQSRSFPLEDVAAGFKALGDPHRVAIVDLLIEAGGPVCVVDIERQLPLTQSTVSYHLKILIDAGLLTRERRGRWMYYSVEPGRLTDLRGTLSRFLERLDERAIASDRYQQASSR